MLIFLFSAFFSWLSCSKVIKLCSSFCLCVHACLLSLEFAFSLNLCACLALFCLVPTCFFLLCLVAYILFVFFAYLSFIRTCFFVSNLF